MSAWIAHLLATGAQPSTAAARLAGGRQFSKWLAADGEIDSDPLLRLNAPKADIPVTRVLTDDQLRALFKAREGKSLRDRRDEAIVRLMAETGTRAGELITLEMDDIDLLRAPVVTRRGKGGKGRLAVPSAVRAADSPRSGSLRPASPQPPWRAQQGLWLGARTHQPLGPHGLRVTLAARAQKAGITGFHPHVMRHTGAARLLARGGSEGGLVSGRRMVVAGHA